MKFYCFVFIVLFLFPAFVRAQSNESIRTGRPGQAIGAYVVGAGFLQVQSGLDISQSKLDVRLSSQNLNNVIRLGLSEKFELSAVVDYNFTDMSRPINIESEGISNFQLGFRYNVIDKPRGWVPGFGIQTRFKLTSVGGDYAAESVAPVFIFATHHKLASSLTWINNLILDYSGDSREDVQHGYASNLSFPLNEKWGSFIEVFGSEQAGVKIINYDTGFGYLVNNDLQLDISAGFGKNQEVENTFVSVGVSWRTKAFTPASFWLEQ